MSTTLPALNQADRFRGLLLGTAVGDALGLPAENLSAEKIRRRWRGDWRMRLIFGRGMVSDDSEHTLMVAQALLVQPKDATAFQRILLGNFAFGSLACRVAWDWRLPKRVLNCGSVFRRAKVRSIRRAAVQRCAVPFSECTLRMTGTVAATSFWLHPA